MLFGNKRQVLLEKIRAGATIIDVRTPGEFAEGAYPGARNLPLQELEGRLAEIGDKEKPVIVYCLSGARSAQAARILKASGFADVNDGGGLGGMPR
jgi:phage shock protein E